MREIHMIEQIIEKLRDFNFISVCFRLVLTVLLSGAIGVERERHGKAAGLRTHIFVCLGAAMAAMTGLYISETYGGTDITRISAQVVSGIGFLGAGTILVRNKSTITGLTTAACIWATGALGLAIGYGFYEAAVLCAVFMLFIAGMLGNIDRKLSHRSREMNVYAEFSDASKLNDTMEKIKSAGFHIISIHLTETKSKLPSGIGAELSIGCKKRFSSEEVLRQLNDFENIHFVIEV